MSQHTGDHRRRCARLGAAATVLALASAPLTALPAAAADPVTLNLLAINDFHGRIEPPTLTAGAVVPGTGTVAFAGTVEQLRQAGGEDNTVFISAGDNIGASLFASATQQDQPTIDVLNELDLDASAVGNHEFDKGFADLRDRVVNGPEATRAQWAYLGANVYAKGTTTPALPEYAIVERAGLRVGIVGVVTQETPTLVSPAGVADLDFGEPVAAVNRVAAQLRDGNNGNGEADVVVASLHEGSPPAPTLEVAVAASAVFRSIVEQTSPEVDAIITGHTHTEYAWQAPVPGVPGKSRPIIQTGSHGQNVGQVTLTVDPDTDEVTAFTVANRPRTQVSEDELVQTFPRVAAVKDTVEDALEVAAVRGNVPVGEITADITTAFLPDGTDADTVPDRDDRASESTLGGLVANVLRDSLASEQRGGAEIGVVNPGGLRADLCYVNRPVCPSSDTGNPDGTVTYAEANAVLPFVNNLWTTSLTGAQLVTLLEQQWQRTARGTVPSRAYLQLGLSDNVTYTFHEVDDPAVPGAKKGVVDSVMIDGEPLDPARSYRIGTFSFLTAGGDNFRVFLDGSNARDSGLVDYEAWIAFLQENKPVAPDFARQSVQVGSQPREVDEGARVEFGLSKLDLTSLGSPANTSVAVELRPATGDAVEVGDFEVSGGAATIAFTAPQAGSYTLVATASPSRTTVQFPLLVNEVIAPPSVEVLARSIADRVRERVFVRVEATNTDTVPVDIAVVTEWGRQEFRQVGPGATVRHRFATGRGSIPAGAVEVQASKVVAGQTYTKTYQATYEAATATVDPRGYAYGESFKVRGEVFLRAYFVNLGADPVTVRLRTDYGSSSRITVQPNRTGTLTVATGERRTPRTAGVVIARKTVDGERYRSDFDVWFPAR